MPITASKHPRGGTQFDANGEMFCILTEATGAALTERFRLICEANDQELCLVTSAVKEARDWNHANPGRGKDWPVFRQLDKLKNRLLAQAGIKDS